MSINIKYHLTKVKAGFFYFNEIELFIAQILRCAAP
jgi:hypothetical protein